MRYSGTSIRRRSRNRQGVIPECQWRQPRRNSISPLAIAIVLFGRISGPAKKLFENGIGQHESNIRQNNLQEPVRHSRQFLAAADARFGSIPGHGQSAILERRLPPPKRNLEMSVAMART